MPWAKKQAKGNATSLPFLPRTLTRRLNDAESSKFVVHTIQPQIRTVEIETLPFVCPHCPTTIKPIRTYDSAEKLWVHTIRRHTYGLDADLVRTRDGKLRLLCQRPPPVTPNPQRVVAATYSRRAPDIYWKKRDNNPADNAPIPIRQYHCSQTYALRDEAKFYLDYKSDDELDDANNWRNDIIEKEIDEYTDVTCPQKTFFKLWNRFKESTSDPVLPLKSLPSLVLQFVQVHGAKVDCDEIIMFLTNLVHERHLKPQDMTQIMECYNNAARKRARIK